MEVVISESFSNSSNIYSMSSGCHSWKNCVVLLANDMRMCVILIMSDDFISLWYSYCCQNPVLLFATAIYLCTN